MTHQVDANNNQSNTSRRRVVLFLLTLGLLILSAVIMLVTLRYQHGQSAELQNPPTTDEIITPVESVADRLTKNLPSKLTEFQAELGLTDYQPSVAYLPAQPTTAISVIDLSDRNRGSFDYNSEIQFTAASTYKIYVAYTMIRDVETGRRTWSSWLNGTTWENCLNRTIINSDNVCPETYLSTIGYPNFNQLVQQISVSSQTHFSPYDMRTTTKDLAVVLQKIYRGELMSKDNKNRLFDLMQQQTYRDGIPAGVGSDRTVSNKVGFLDPLRHDAGIVHSPQGDYVLVIMTNYNSWPYIAKIANYIDSEMTHS